MPDKNGALIVDVVLGYDDLASYEVNGCFWCNDLLAELHREEREVLLTVWGQKVLAQNENDNNLHSGPNGFEKKIWNVAEISQDKNSIVFNRISPDGGENGYPGDFDVSVKYEFTEETN